MIRTGAEKMVCNQRRTEAGASHFSGSVISSPIGRNNALLAAAMVVSAPSLSHLAKHHVQRDFMVAQAPMQTVICRAWFDSVASQHVRTSM